MLQTKIADFIDAEYKLKSTHTRASYKNAFQRLFKWMPALQDQQVFSTLSPQAVIEFYKCLQTQSAKSSTLAHYDKVLRLVTKRMENYSHLFDLPSHWRTPWREVKKLRAKPEPKQPLSRKQLRKLVNDFDPVTYDEWLARIVVVILAGTGLRASELADLELRNYSRQDSKFRVLGKGDKTRDVYLSKAVIDEIETYFSVRPESPWLVVGEEGEKLDRHGIAKAVETFGRLAGISLHPHLLRHTYASILLNEQQAPLKYVQEQLGHEDVKTTMGYVHLIPEQMAEMANKYGI